MSPEQLFLVVLASSALGFGGFGALPVLHRFLSQAGLSADTLIVQALTVGRLSPGPNGLYLVAIGFFVAGVPGAVAASLAVLIPPLAIIPLAHLRDRLEHHRRFRATLRALGLAVVALLVATTVSIVRETGTSPVAVALIVAAWAALVVRTPSVLLLVLGAAVGYVAL